MPQQPLLLLRGPYSSSSFRSDSSILQSSEMISRNETTTECLQLPEISGYSYDNLLHCAAQRETLASVVEKKKRLAVWGEGRNGYKERWLMMKAGRWRLVNEESYRGEDQDADEGRRKRRGIDQ
ncbi:unnamed protein product [Sphagnum troendelagicum]|uniref:Uncharacterized protein n=1 Tax=Sphagnum troendelagicum TaxID=128251 RepID=A0ABP0U737_9BRYO